MSARTNLDRVPTPLKAIDQPVIRNVSDLPVMFDLQSYIRADQLTLCDWIVQLYLRQRVRHQRCQHGQPTVWFHGLIRDWCPAFTWDDPEAFELRNLRVEDILSLNKHLTTLDAQPNEVLTPAYLNEHADTAGVFPYALLKIDLSAPDKILFEQFCMFLDETRWEQTRVTRMRYTLSVFRFWAQSRALAYWDLLNWAETMRVVIAPSLMAEVLFPESTTTDRDTYVRELTPRVLDELKDPLTLGGLVNAYQTEHHQIPILADDLDLTTLNHKKHLTKTTPVCCAQSHEL